MAEKALRYLVSGRVQGVFYRASTAETARNLSLSGWAKNLRDGSVEVVARGDEAALAKLARWLWEGPPSARVERVSMTEWPDEVPDGFTTR